jgi:hypothetical protein
MYCPCGQEIESTSCDYSQAIYKGNEIVYAVCVHGFVVINLGEENENPGVGG